jgi:hypothetical protein
MTQPQTIEPNIKIITTLMLWQKDEPKTVRDRDRTISLKERIEMTKPIKQFEQSD